MRRKENGSSSEGSINFEITDAAFAAGYVTRYVEEYAQAKNIPSAILASGVAAILHSHGPGSEHPMRQVRKKATKAHSTVGEVEVGGGARDAVQGLKRKKRKLSRKGLAAIRKAQKARWVKERGSKKKRKLSAAQLTAMRNNAALARKAHELKHAA